jgi:hypothetical protein
MNICEYHLWKTRGMLILIGGVLQNIFQIISYEYFQLHYVYYHHLFHGLHHFFAFTSIICYYYVPKYFNKDISALIIKQTKSNNTTQSINNTTQSINNTTQSIDDSTHIVSISRNPRCSESEPVSIELIDEYSSLEDTYGNELE